MILCIFFSHLRNLKSGRELRCLKFETRPVFMHTQTVLREYVTSCVARYWFISY